MRKRPVLIGTAALAVLGSGFVLTSNPDVSSTAAEATEAPSTTETVTVKRQNLVETAEATGTVGNGTPLPLPVDAQGTVTWAPEQNDVLRAGDVAVRVDNRPVHLAAGETPLYRELRLVSSSERDAAGDKLGVQTGPDVVQLQQFLLSQGFDDDGSLEADGTFGASTKRAVKDWQESVGHPATGRVDRTQLLFISGDVRVDEAPVVGQPFSPIHVTKPSRIVTATIKSSLRDFFPVGANVSLDASETTLSGTITKATRTTGQDGSTVYELEITADEGELPEGAGTIEVTASRTVVEDAATVPVRALLALAEGGWAVQVESPTGLSLVAVELGEVVEGIAEITGVADGTEVVVPT